MESNDITVEPVDECDVDVRETVKERLDARGIDANISFYEQPMLRASTLRKVGEKTTQSYTFSIPANLICTQEELEDKVDERIDEWFESVGIEK